MNNNKIKNNKSINSKSTNNKNTKISKKRKQPKFKKNTTIIVLYLTSLVFYIVSFFTLRLIHIKNKINLINELKTGDTNFLELLNDEINKQINLFIDKINKISPNKIEANGKYINLQGCVTSELKFGFNYLSLLIDYNIIDDNTDYDNSCSKINSLQIKENSCSIKGKAELKINYTDHIEQNNINSDNIIEQIMDNFYEKLIIKIIDYIIGNIFGGFEDKNNKINTNICLNTRRSELGLINTCNIDKGIIKGLIPTEFENQEIKTKIYEKINELTNQIQTYLTTFLKPIEECGEDNNLYTTMNNRIEKQINSSKETMILIINYIKKTRIIIISILVLVILLKIIQIFTNLSIITILYHLISYISLIILLVLSITLFIPKKVLSQQKYTKKITKNLKFIVNIENILMFVGAMLLLAIKIMEMIK